MSVAASSAASAPFLLVHAQNAFTSLPFVAAFLPLAFFTGAWLPLLVALAGALAVHFVVSCFANRLSAPSAREAVLITGCSRGLGEATALHLAELGYTVFATVRREEDSAALLRKAGRSSARLLPIRMDITQQQSVDAAVAEVDKRIASDRLSLRVLVNNAGGLVTKAFSGVEVLPPEALARSFASNTVAPLRVTQAFLPLLRAAAARGERARIVFTSSVAGVFPPPQMGSYAAAKFAQEGMADCLRMELRSSGVDVCVVRPGNMDTPSNLQLQRDATSIDEMAAANPRVDRSVLAYYDRINKGFDRLQPGRPRFALSQLTRAHEHIVRARWVHARYSCGWDSFASTHFFSRLPEYVRDYAMLTGAVGKCWQQ